MLLLPEPPPPPLAHFPISPGRLPQVQKLLMDQLVKRRHLYGHSRERAETEMRCWWGAHVGDYLAPAAPGRRGCLCIRQEQGWTDTLVGLKATVKLEHIKGAKETRRMGRLTMDGSLLLGRAGPSSYPVPGIAGP